MLDILTTKQMERLEEFGVDTSKASMYTGVIQMDSVPTEVVVSRDYATYWMENSDVVLLPVFTLSDVLGFFKQGYVLRQDSITIKMPDMTELFFTGSDAINAAFIALFWYVQYKFYGRTTKN